MISGEILVRATITCDSALSSSCERQVIQEYDHSNSIQQAKILLMDKAGVQGWRQIDGKHICKICFKSIFDGTER